MLDHGNGQLSAVGFFNASVGAPGAAPFFGGGVGGSAKATAFDLESAATPENRNLYRVVRQYLYFGRTLVIGEESTELTLPPNSDWVVFAVVSHTSTGKPSLSVVKGAALDTYTSDIDKTYVALYFNKARDRLVDLRTMPYVPAYLP